MRASTILNATANIAVVVVVAAYLYSASSGSGSPASVGAEPPTINLTEEEWTLLTAGGTTIGSERGAPALVEFMDYECPYCVASQRHVERYFDGASTGSIVVRHFPLPMHEFAEGAARAALCADGQGHFEQMHHLLLSDSTWHSTQDWTALASEAGIERIAEFGECLASESTTRRLHEDHELAVEFGVHATPTFVSRERIHQGGLDRWTLDKLTAELITQP